MQKLIDDASGFDRIGPYRLSARDLIAACFVISFRTGSASTRVYMYLFLILMTVFIVGGIAIENYLLLIVGASLILLYLFINPFFQSRKNKQQIFLSYDREGIAVETDEVRSLYKWATIRTFCKIRSLLLIQITDAHALVIADRFTTAANMDRVCSTLTQNCQGKAVASSATA